MHFQYVPYIWPYIASTMVTLILAAYALRHKNIRGTIPFGLCMLLTALWSGSYALQISGTNLATVLFWAAVQSIAYSINPVLWLIMAFQFIERDSWVTKRNIMLLLVIPILSVIIAWSNGMHGLMWQNVYLDTGGAYPVMAKTYGAWFWFIAAYSYGLNIISELMLALSLRRKSALFREQALALFIGLALLFVQNAFYIFGINDYTGYDLTSVTAGVSGLIIAWGIFYYRLFDIVPVARENIIENMADGLIVLDAQNRIADMNPAARHIFNLSSTRTIGLDAQQFFADWPALAQVSYNRDNTPGELILRKKSTVKTFEISYLPLHDAKGRHNGLTIILHDVTEKKINQAKLLEQEKTLAILDERERLVRDLHDNLGQVLGFINVQAQAIKRELKVSGLPVAKLERLIEVAQSAHQDMRTYIINVKKTTTRDFIPALKNSIKQYISQSGIDVTLQITGESQLEGLEPDIGEQIMYIIKESLNNIRKHAQARQVFIEITATVAAISVQIKDDGLGFDVMTYQNNPVGLGLNIMQERAKGINGELIIESLTGQGTTINLHVPC